MATEADIPQIIHTTKKEGEGGDSSEPLNLEFNELPQEEMQKAEHIHNKPLEILNIGEKGNMQVPTNINVDTAISGSRGDVGTVEDEVFIESSSVPKVAFQEISSAHTESETVEHVKDREEDHMKTCDQDAEDEKSGVSAISLDKVMDDVVITKQSDETENEKIEREEMLQCSTDTITDLEKQRPIESLEEIPKEKETTYQTDDMEKQSLEEKNLSQDGLSEKTELEEESNPEESANDSRFSRPLVNETEHLGGEKQGQDSSAEQKNEDEPETASANECIRKHVQLEENKIENQALASTGEENTTESLKNDEEMDEVPKEEMIEKNGTTRDIFESHAGEETNEEATFQKDEQKEPNDEVAEANEEGKDTSMPTKNETGNDKECTESIEEKSIQEIPLEAEKIEENKTAQPNVEAENQSIEELDNADFLSSTASDRNTEENVNEKETKTMKSEEEGNNSGAETVEQTLGTTFPSEEAKPKTGKDGEDNDTRCTTEASTVTVPHIYEEETGEEILHKAATPVTWVTEETCLKEVNPENTQSEHSDLVSDTCEPDGVNVIAKIVEVTDFGENDNRDGAVEVGGKELHEAQSENHDPSTDKTLHDPLTEENVKDPIAPLSREHNGLTTEASEITDETSKKLEASHASTHSPSDGETTEENILQAHEKFTDPEVHAGTGSSNVKMASHSEGEVHDDDQKLQVTPALNTETTITVSEGVELPESIKTEASDVKKASSNEEVHEDDQKLHMAPAPNTETNIIESGGVELPDIIKTSKAFDVEKASSNEEVHDDDQKLNVAPAPNTEINIIESGRGVELPDSIKTSEASDVEKASSNEEVHANDQKLHMAPAPNTETNIIESGVELPDSIKTSEDSDVEKVSSNEEVHDDDQKLHMAPALITETNIIESRGVELPDSIKTSEASYASTHSPLAAETTEEKIMQRQENYMDPEIHAHAASPDMEKNSADDEKVQDDGQQLDLTPAPNTETSIIKPEGEELPESIKTGDVYNSSHVGELETSRDGKSENTNLENDNLEDENTVNDTFIQECNASIVTKEAILSQENSRRNFKGSSNDDVEIEKSIIEVETGGCSQEVDVSETKSTNETAEKVPVTNEESPDTITPVMEEPESEKDCITQSIEQNNVQESSQEVQKRVDDQSDKANMETKNQTTEEIANTNLLSSTSVEKTIQESFKGEERDVLESTEEVKNSGMENMEQSFDTKCTSEDTKDEILKDGSESETQCSTGTSTVLLNEINEDVAEESAVRHVHEEQTGEEILHKAETTVTEEKETTKSEKLQEYTLEENQKETHILPTREFDLTSSEALDTTDEIQEEQLQIKDESIDTHAPRHLASSDIEKGNENETVHEDDQQLQVTDDLGTKTGTMVSEEVELPESIKARQVSDSSHTGETEISKDEKLLNTESEDKVEDQMPADDGANEERDTSTEIEKAILEEEHSASNFRSSLEEDVNIEKEVDEVEARGHIQATEVPESKSTNTVKDEEIGENKSATANTETEDKNTEGIAQTSLCSPTIAEKNVEESLEEEEKDVTEIKEEVSNSDRELSEQNIDTRCPTEDTNADILKDEEKPYQDCDIQSTTDASTVTPAEETGGDLHENTSVPCVSEKEPGEEILHESKTIITGVTEETALKELNEEHKVRSDSDSFDLVSDNSLMTAESLNLDDADIKHAEVSKFDESKNTEILTPKISDERDVSTSEMLQDFISEQNHKEPYSTSSSEHALLTTEASETTDDTAEKFGASYVNPHSPLGTETTEETTVEIQDMSINPEVQAFMGSSDMEKGSANEEVHDDEQQLPTVPARNTEGGIAESGSVELPKISETDEVTECSNSGQVENFDDEKWLNVEADKEKLEAPVNKTSNEACNTSVETEKASQEPEHSDRNVETSLMEDAEIVKEAVELKAGDPLQEVEVSETTCTDNVTEENPEPAETREQPRSNFEPVTGDQSDKVAPLLDDAVADVTAKIPKVSVLGEDKNMEILTAPKEGEFESEGKPDHDMQQETCDTSSKGEDEREISTADGPPVYTAEQNFEDSSTVSSGEHSVTEASETTNEPQEKVEAFPINTYGPSAAVNSGTNEEVHGEDQETCKAREMNTEKTVSESQEVELQKSTETSGVTSHSDIGEWESLQVQKPLNYELDEEAEKTVTDASNEACNTSIETETAILEQMKDQEPAENPEVTNYSENKETSKSQAAAESEAEYTNNKTCSETNTTEESCKSFNDPELESVGQQIIGEDFQEGQREPESEATNQSKETLVGIETIKDAMLNEEVSEAVEKAEESENINRQTVEEEITNKMRNPDQTPVVNLEAVDSSETAETLKQQDPEDLNGESEIDMKKDRQKPVSIASSELELSSEKIEETNTCDDKTDIAPMALNNELVELETNEQVRCRTELEPEDQSIQTLQETKTEEDINSVKKTLKSAGEDITGQDIQEGGTEMPGKVESTLEPENQSEERYTTTAEKIKDVIWTEEVSGATKKTTESENVEEEITKEESNLREHQMMLASDIIDPAPTLTDNPVVTVSCENTETVRLLASEDLDLESEASSITKEPEEDRQKSTEESIDIIRSVSAKDTFEEENTKETAGYNDKTHIARVALVTEDTTSEEVQQEEKSIRDLDTNSDDKNQEVKPTSTVLQGEKVDSEKLEDNSGILSPFTEDLNGESEIDMKKDRLKQQDPEDLNGESEIDMKKDRQKPVSIASSELELSSEKIEEINTCDDKTDIAPMALNNELVELETNEQVRCRTELEPEDQSIQTPQETKTEEDINSVKHMTLESAGEDITGQDIQEGGTEMPGKVESTLEPENQSEETYTTTAEKIKDVIWTEEVSGVTKKTTESENVEEEITKEESSLREHQMMLASDIIDPAPTLTDNPVVSVSCENTETVKLLASEDLNLESEASSITKEPEEDQKKSTEESIDIISSVSAKDTFEEENTKETAGYNDKTHIVPVALVTEDTTSEEVQQEEKSTRDLDTNSDDKTQEVKPTSTVLQGEKVDSEKLEDNSGILSPFTAEGARENNEHENLENTYGVEVEEPKTSDAISQSKEKDVEDIQESHKSLTVAEDKLEEEIQEVFVSEPNPQRVDSIIAGEVLLHQTLPSGTLTEQVQQQSCTMPSKEENTENTSTAETLEEDNIKKVENIVNDISEGYFATSTEEEACLTNAEPRELEVSNLKLEPVEVPKNDSADEAPKEENTSLGEATSVEQQENASKKNFIDFPSESENSLGVEKPMEVDEKCQVPFTIDKAMDLPSHYSTVNEISTIKVDEKCQVPSTLDFQKKEKAVEFVSGEEQAKSEETEMKEEQIITVTTKPETEEHLASETTTNEIENEKAIEKEFAKDSTVGSTDKETIISNYKEDVQLAERDPEDNKIQELDTATDAIQKEKLSKELDSASLDEDKKKQVTGKDVAVEKPCQDSVGDQVVNEIVQEPEWMNVAEASVKLDIQKMSDDNNCRDADTGATALTEEVNDSEFMLVEHQDGMESPINKTLTTHNEVEDELAEEAPPKVWREVEEISEGTPKEPAHERIQAYDMKTDIEEEHVNSSESLKDDEKTENTTLESTFDGCDTTDDLNLNERGISLNEARTSLTTESGQKETEYKSDEEPSNIISDKQITSKMILQEEVKFNKDEAEHTKDQEKVDRLERETNEEFDEAKIHGTVNADGDVETEDKSGKSNELSQNKDSSVEITQSCSMDLVPDKDVLVEPYPNASKDVTQVQQVPDKQTIQESALGVEPEVKEVERGEEVIAGEDRKECTEKSAMYSSSDLLKGSTKATSQVPELTIEQREPKDCKQLEADNAEKIAHVEEAKEDEEEEGDEHKRVDSGSDAPVMVEASSDVTEKVVVHKKSHNILSGVGSKVKHSIAKVKKVITGKSSHPKPSSPK